jgi:hypothetical protein
MPTDEKENNEKSSLINTFNKLKEEMKTEKKSAEPVQKGKEAKPVKLEKLPDSNPSLGIDPSDPNNKLKDDPIDTIREQKEAYGNDANDSDDAYRP